MAIETQTKVPYRIELCFECEAENEAKRPLGALKTAMLITATSVTDDGKKISYTLDKPIDLALDEAARVASQEYLGEQMATLIEGVGSDRTAATKLLDETKAAHEAATKKLGEDHAAAMKVQADERTAAQQAASEAAAASLKATQDAHTEATKQLQEAHAKAVADASEAHGTLKDSDFRTY